MNITITAKEEVNPGNNTKPLIFQRPIYKLSISTEYYNMNVNDRLTYLELLEEWTKKERDNLNNILSTR